jgi:hypothetical protein
MVRGMPQINHIEQLCDTCVVTKHKRRLFLDMFHTTRKSSSSLSTATSVVPSYR